MASKKRVPDPTKGAEIEGRVLTRLKEMGKSVSEASVEMGLQRTVLGTTLARIKRSGRIGPETLPRLEKYLQRSGDWIRHGAQRVVQRDARYPNLEDAIEHLGNKISEETRVSSRELAAHSPVDLDFHVWVEMLQDLERKARRAAKTGATPERLLEHEADDPPAAKP